MGRRSFFAWIAGLFCWKQSPSVCRPSSKGGGHEQNVVILYPSATLDRNGRTITTISMKCFSPGVYESMAEEAGWPSLGDCHSFKNERDELIKLAGIVAESPLRIIG